MSAYLFLGAELAGEPYDKNILMLDAQYDCLYERSGATEAAQADSSWMLNMTDCVCAVGQLKQHKLTAYRAALVGVLKAQIKSERLEPGLAGVMQLADSVALKVRASSQACKQVLASACQHKHPSRCVAYQLAISGLAGA